MALCAASLAHVTYLSLGVETQAFWPWPPPSVLLLVSATLFIYNLDRLSPAATEDLGDADLDERAPSGALKRLMWVMMLASLPMMAWCAWVMPWHLVWALMPAALIATGYALPLLYWRGRWRRLKEIPGVKVVLIALVWSIATVTIPAWEQALNPLSNQALFEAASRTLFIFAITLPFDVRDMARDERARIITIPLLLGVTHTRALSMGLLGVMLALQGILHGFTSTSMFWPVLITCGITGLLLARMHAQQSERYYAVYMEGTMGLYALMMWVWWWIR